MTDRSERDIVEQELTGMENIYNLVKDMEYNSAIRALQWVKDVLTREHLRCKIEEDERPL